MTETTQPPEQRESLLEDYRTIDGRELIRLCQGGLQWLRTNQELVNTLNVFPVPDGDTGTNMVLTMKSAAGEVEDAGERAVGEVAHKIAHGALMGARGNSGVILSQIWRGFARALEGESAMDVDDLVAALNEARDTAYKGVVRPVEGTILTVSKDIASGAQKALDEGTTSVLEMLEKIVQAADQSVERTPDLLPVLAEAGVVDAGGKGLYFILEGMLRLAYQQPLDEPLASIQSLGALSLATKSEHIEPGQDWEVVVDFKPHDSLDIEEFYSQLEEMGTSIQLGEGDGIHRMHIHTPDNEQYLPIDYCRSLGTVTKVAIENLMDQTAAEDVHAETGFPSPASVEPGQIATVVVAPGAGIARVFASLGAAAIVEGGQTMNPSTREILRAFEDLPTDKIVILPNNKNILLAAEQAKDLTVKQVAVVPAISVPQGVAAMFALEPDGDFDEIVESMRSALADPKSGAVTRATRSVELDGVQVKEGQVIGLLDGKLVASSDSLEESLTQVLEAAETNEAELITLYYGEDLSPQQANRIADSVRERWAGQEVEVVEGGQPHYQLILAIE